MEALEYTDIRPLSGTSEINQISSLERQVWGTADIDCFPPSLAIATIHTGGLIIGAFDEDVLIGVCVGLPTTDRKRLWSYMTAVHPEYQNQRLGLRLKLAQREYAIAHGYKKIAWTFDPLLSRNAYFNLSLLGATGIGYHIDFYGPLSDDINRNMPSDRLEVEWNIEIDLQYKAASIKHLSKTSKPLLKIDQLHLEPDVDLTVLDTGSDCSIEVPANIDQLRSLRYELAHQWTLALRSCMGTAFSIGYQIIGLEQHEGQFAYFLRRSQGWYLYVATCSDGSLYTGISTNVRRRITQHNASKGAAYTASRTPITLAGMWSFPDRPSALKAESKFKKLKRSHKQLICQSRLDFEGASYVDIDHLSA
jgi:predicted GNAT superfamily acetyltransferase/predicted GIY-YIG superfamily endonuclease